MKWLQDEVFEDKCKKLDLAWSIVSIDMKCIDLTYSLAQSGRIVSLDDTKVDEFAMAMLDGASFPMVAVVSKGRGRYALVCGNHRGHAAREADLASIDAYLLDDNDAEKLAAISVEDNMRHGVGLTVEERCALAVRWIDRFGHKQKEVAARYLVSEATLSAYITARNVREVVSKAGLRSSAMSLSQAVALNSIVQANQRVAVEIARFVIKHGLSAEKTRKLVQVARGGKNEQDMLDRLADETAKLEKLMRPSQVGRAPRRARFLSAISRMKASLEECHNFEAAQIMTVGEQDQVAASLKLLAKLIRDFLNASH